ncbi:hypothetical protein ACPCA8_23535 [Streptomyces capoamus]
MAGPADLVLGGGEGYSPYEDRYIDGASGLDSRGLGFRRLRLDFRRA